MIQSIQTKTSLKSVQALRATAALMVVFFHLMMVETKYGNTNLVFQFFHFGEAGVDLFFVISGFIMVLVTSSEQGTKIEPGRFLYNRFTRIYPTYWFYFLLVLVVWFIKPGWVNSSATTEPDFISSFFLIPNNGMQFVQVAWTLEYEIFFYIIFAIAITLPRPFSLPVVLLTLSALVFTGLVTKTTSPVAATVTSTVLLEFVAGCLIGYFYLKNQKSSSLYYLALLTGFGLFVLELLHFSWVSYLPEDLLVVQRELAYGLPAALLVFGATFIEKHKTVKIPNWLLKIGDASYSLYLSHILVLAFIGKLWTLMGMNNLLPNHFMLVTMLISTVVVGIASHKLVEKPLIFLFRKKNNITEVKHVTVV
ncbi:acyltransferase family protein [Pontibacter sp. MBLB2868]|uniref:acyltransferase family protein n=1 Tax=Pontibacter sp. MBLB2868 TaxID=3451555 RepID=UPI003F74C550